MFLVVLAVDPQIMLTEYSIEDCIIDEVIIMSSSTYIHLRAHY